MAKVTIDSGLCKGCGLCVTACPQKIVRLSPDTLNNRGVHPAEVTNDGACTSCAFCAVMCPDSVIRVEKP